MENGKKEKKLFVIYPQKRAEEGRLDQVLRAALEGISAQVVDSMEELWENGDHENVRSGSRGDGCFLQYLWGKTESTVDIMRSWHGSAVENLC